MAEGSRIERRLPFSLLPGTTALFRDFVEDFPRVAEFYPGDPRELMDSLDPDKLLSDREFSRPQLARILETQNRHWDCSPETLANIESLRDPRSMVVVTGQQVGLFTGPLFTVYKALSVLQLVRQLRQQYGPRFLPLFWMATDDHDYDEVNQANFVGRANNLVALEHGGHHQAGRPAGIQPLDPGIEPLLAQVDELLPDSEFKDQAKALFFTSYGSAASFGDAFARTMLALFAREGLVLVDPMDPDLRRLCLTVFRNELEQAPRGAELVARRGADLMVGGYHAQLQVSPGGVNLFLFMDGLRTGLIRESSGFRLKTGQQEFSLRELIELLETSPQRFSPSAALRPVVQDFLFPVAAYVAGPAEIAYCAQLGSLYDLHGVPRAAVFPRVSMTLVESGLQELLEKFELHLEDTFVPRERLRGRVSEDRLPGDLEGDIESAMTTIRETFGILSEKAVSFEPTMVGYLDSASGKLDHQLKAIRQKLLQAHRSRDETIREQISKISNRLFPAGRLQERVLNVIPFLARHGPDLLGELAPLSAEPWDHLAVQIGR